MSKIKSTRIQSIDVLRGLVMVIMALDHVRGYFHLNATLYDPTDLEQTTTMLFFTRFVTHYCAPAFVFLAGTSAFLYGRNKTKAQLARFLFSRGLWLVFVEVVVMNLLWFFDPGFSFINLQVIWAIGLCMIALSVLCLLPQKVVLAIGLIILFGHNALDGIVYGDYSAQSVLWYILHQQNFIPVGDRMIHVAYPILPWIGVMATGYCFGMLYGREFDLHSRRKWLTWLGFGSLLLFVIIRSTNLYGDMAPWSVQESPMFTFLSFINVTKYPPSLLYVLITLGPAFLFLRYTENWRNQISNFLLVFGRVPFFYYLLHILLIHLAAILGLILTGKDWRLMILTNDVLFAGKLQGYGYSLWVVYAVWIAVVILLYPVCRAYMRYKASNRKKWWLSYL